ncbi:MAG: CDP-alcohol phosphatidyltransferase family protein [Anaerolineales bacterium]|nr:CDP-alcohol phosphatidyltransferase family protein [Anaerolineales bacterium]
MANTLLGSEKIAVKRSWTLEEIRRTSAKDTESELIYRLLRPISLRLVWVFLRWNVAPNTITFLFIGCLVLAAVVLALRPIDGSPIAALLILASYVLDSCDGAVARATKRLSTAGDKLDMLGHWITNSLLILGATLGQIGAGSSNSAWLIGMVAMLGTNSYYYMQYNLLPHASSNHTNEANKLYQKPSLVNRIRGLFHTFAPLDTNLLIVASLIGFPFMAIQIWALLSNVASLVIFGQYYWRETRQS